LDIIRLHPESAACRQLLLSPISTDMRNTAPVREILTKHYRIDFMSIKPIADSKTLEWVDSAKLLSILETLSKEEQISLLEKCLERLTAPGTKASDKIVDIIPVDDKDTMDLIDAIKKIGISKTVKDQTNSMLNTRKLKSSLSDYLEELKKNLNPTAGLDSSSNNILAEQQLDNPNKTSKIIPLVPEGRFGQDKSTGFTPVDPPQISNSYEESSSVKRVSEQELGNSNKKGKTKETIYSEVD